MGKKIYRAIKAFPHGHASIEVGTTIALTRKQAMFLKIGGFIKEAPLPTKMAPATAPAAAPAGDLASTNTIANTKKESKQ